MGMAPFHFFNDCSPVCFQFFPPYTTVEPLCRRWPGARAAGAPGQTLACGRPTRPPDPVPTRNRGYICSLISRVGSPQEFDQLCDGLAPTAASRPRRPSASAAAAPRRPASRRNAPSRAQAPPPRCPNRMSLLPRSFASNSIRAPLLGTAIEIINPSFFPRPKTIC